MDLHPIFKWLEASSLATSIRGSLLFFPLLESFHVMALAVVFGSITIVDLRLLGLASANRSYQFIERDLIKWTWGGFGMAVLTGALMFTVNAPVYAENAFFRAKLILLAFAGLNMLAFTFTAHRTVRQWERNPSAPTAGKVAAVLSVALWISIIVVGRLIGFTTTGAAAKLAPPTNTNFDDFLGAAASGGPPAPPPR